MNPNRRPPLFIIWLLGMTGCATREEALIEALRAIPPAADPVQALSDPDAGVRCQAAKTCGDIIQSTACVHGLTKAVMVSLDAAHPCIYAALASACGVGGRAALATLAASVSAADRENATAAVKMCPSADALLALDDVFGPPAAEEDARMVWLRTLESNPEPKDALRKEIQWMEAMVERKNEEAAAAAQSAAEKARAAEARQHAAAASAALDAGKVDVARAELNTAQHLGFGATDLQSKVEAAEAAQRAKDAKKHLARAWALLKKIDFDAADDEKDQAEKLGADTELIDAFTAALQAKRDQGAMKSWKVFTTKCRRINSDQAAFDRVANCNARCQRIQQKVQDAWAELQHAEQPALPSADASVEKVKEWCEQAGCPTCP